MLEKVKLALRVTTDAFNTDITGLIDAALADLGLVGIICPENDPLISRAVITYCRCNFGSPGDYDKLKKSYDEQKAQLKNSSLYTEPMESGC